MYPNLPSSTSLSTYLHAVIGIVAAIAMTAGLCFAMAMDLQRSFASDEGVRPIRRGIVIVESVDPNDPAVVGVDPPGNQLAIAPATVSASGPRAGRRTSAAKVCRDGVLVAVK
jgi:hypothetical protein